MIKLNPKYMHGIKIQDLGYQVAGEMLNRFLKLDELTQGLWIEQEEFTQAYNWVGSFWREQRKAIYCRDLIAEVEKTSTFVNMDKKTRRKLGFSAN